MTEQTRKIMMNMADTIQGEINRMCVTKDITELDIMASCARKNIEKLQKIRYEDLTHSEIQVGDVLKYESDLDDDTALEYIVTYMDVDGKTADAICFDGAVYQNIDLCNMVKTGRHFDHIAINLAERRVERR